MGGSCLVPPSLLTFFCLRLGRLSARPFRETENRKRTDFAELELLELELDCCYVGERPAVESKPPSDSNCSKSKLSASVSATSELHAL